MDDRMKEQLLFSERLTEKVRPYMEKAGPAYVAHWDAWVEMHNQDVEEGVSAATVKDPARAYEMLELEMCSQVMMSSIMGVAGNAPARALVQAIALTAIAIAKKNHLTDEQFQNLLITARKEHWRVYPHPPEMKLREGDLWLQL